MLPPNELPDDERPPERPELHDEELLLCDEELLLYVLLLRRVLLLFVFAGWRVALLCCWLTVALPDRPVRPELVDVACDEP